MLNRKPIIAVHDSNVNNTYKHTFPAYAAGVELLFLTDLSYKQFENLFAGRYTRQDVDQWETTGSFERSVV